MHDFWVSFLSCLLPPITIKTGIDFLESWHGIATGNIRTSGQEGESVLLKLSGKNFNDVCDSAAVIGKLFDGIFEKQSKCCCLLRINQLLHVAEIDILFSDQETIFSMYFYFELFRPAFLPWERTAGVCFCMMRWLSGNLNSGALTGFRGYFPHNPRTFSEISTG